MPTSTSDLKDMISMLLALLAWDNNLISDSRAAHLIGCDLDKIHDVRKTFLTIALARQEKPHAKIQDHNPDRGWAPTRYMLPPRLTMFTSDEANASVTMSITCRVQIDDGRTVRDRIPPTQQEAFYRFDLQQWLCCSCGEPLRYPVTHWRPKSDFDTVATESPGRRLDSTIPSHNQAAEPERFEYTFRAGWDRTIDALTRYRQMRRPNT